jgi:hypothetical protein
LELTVRPFALNDSQLTSATIAIVTGLLADRLTICIRGTRPEGAKKTRLAGLATTVPLRIPVPTLMVTVIVAGGPMLGMTVICPMNVPTGSLAAVADTVRVAGLVGLTKLPLDKVADRKLGESVVTPMIAIGLGLVVDSVTVCDPALCPESALNVRVGGLATKLLAPPGGLTTRVTGTVCTMPFEFSKIVPAYVPTNRPAWFAKTSKVWLPTRLPLGCTVSQLVTPP